eukprot:gene12309-biopygen2077
MRWQQGGHSWQGASFIALLGNNTITPAIPPSPVFQARCCGLPVPPTPPTLTASGVSWQMESCQRAQASGAGVARACLPQRGARMSQGCAITRPLILGLLTPGLSVRRGAGVARAYA